MFITIADSAETTKTHDRQPALDKQWIVISLLSFACWIAVYWSYFSMLVGRWDNEDYSYCFLVPLVFVWLIYEARKKILPNIQCSPGVGYLLLALGILLYLSGKLGSLETIVYGSMWLTLAAMVGILFGRKVIFLLWFPFLILLFAIPAPPFATSMLSLKLKLISSVAAAKVLGLLNVPVYLDGNFIDLGSIQLQVVDACSGLRYLVPTVLLSLLMGYFFLRRYWTKILIFIISPAIAIISNSIRIAITGLLVKYISPDLAEGFFHDFSGWLVYVITILFISLLVFGLRFLEKSRKADFLIKSISSQPTVYEKPCKRYSFIFIMCIIGMYIFQSFLFQNQIIPERNSFTSFPEKILLWNGSRMTLDQEVLDELWSDDYLMITFHNEVTENQLQLFVPYYERQTTQYTAHAPTSCLLGGGWGLQKKEVLPADVNGPRNFPVSRMLLTKGQNRILSIFWFEQRGRHITSEYVNKFMLFWDALVKRRTDGALVRVELLLKPGQSLAEGQKLIDPFLKELKNHLEHYVPM